MFGFVFDDSLFGLFVWIVDKWLSWSDFVCLFDDDLIFMMVMIYWVTRTIGLLMCAYVV